jgi:hypothetical protein
MGEALWPFGACQALANGILARDDLTECQKKIVLRGRIDSQLVCRAVALAGLCGLRAEPEILDDEEHEYEVHMGCDLYQARYLPDGLMWVVEAEGTACASTVDDRGRQGRA